MKLVSIKRLIPCISALLYGFAFDVSAYGAYEYTRSVVTYDNIVYGYNLTKSVVSFYPSFTWNWARYGSAYSIDLIMPSPFRTSSINTPTLIRDDKGKIAAIDDGKEFAIVLGGIPSQLQHLDEIAALIKTDDFSISSFNLDFERRWANWQWLRQKRPALKLKLYPTVDYTAPRHIDLIRFVIDVYDRETAVLAQCKAGKGRSATAVGAYLMVISFMAGDLVSVDEVEEYLQRLRPRVDFNVHHRQALQVLRNELLLLNDDPTTIIVKLKSKYSVDIAAREQEIKEQFSSQWQ